MIPNRGGHLRQSHFGPFVEIPMPPGADAVIVAVHRYQREPKLLKLPHQIYVKVIAELMADPGVNDVEVIPIRSPEWVSVAHHAPVEEAASWHGWHGTEPCDCP